MLLKRFLSRDAVLCLSNIFLNVFLNIIERINAIYGTRKGMNVFVVNPNITIRRIADNCMMLSFIIFKPKHPF